MSTGLPDPEAPRSIVGARVLQSFWNSLPGDAGTRSYNMYFAII